MMRRPRCKAFGHRKTVSYHTVAENRNKLQLASRIPLDSTAVASPWDLAKIGLANREDGLG